MSDEQTQEQKPDPMVDTVKAQVESGALKLPEKFGNDAEAFVKSYRELEKQFHNKGSGNEPTQPESGSTAESGGAAGSGQDDSTAEATADGASSQDWTDLSTSTEKTDTKPETSTVDWSVVEEELRTKNQVSPETAKAMGLPDEMVKSLNEGRKAQIERDKSEAQKLVGGEDQFNEMMKWAKTALDEKAREYWMQQLRGDNWRHALPALKAKWEAEAAQQNKQRRTTASPTGSNVKPFTSQQELNQAVADPRYKTDPAYRKHVQDRLAASSR